MRQRAQLNLRLNADDITTLKQIARQNKTTVSELCRDYITNALKKPSLARPITKPLDPRPIYERPSVLDRLKPPSLPVLKAQKPATLIDEDGIEMDILPQTDKAYQGPPGKPPTPESVA